MSESTSVWVIFCDDVRMELGNKASYMGIYGPNLLVESFPTSLSKLCIAAYVRSPIANPPKQVVLKILHDEAVVMEQDIPVPSVESVSADFVSQGATMFTFTVLSQLINFPIADRSILKVRAIVDGEEIKGGQLLIDKLPDKH